MDDISELEGRITRALDRIRAGLDQRAAAAGDAAADAGQAAALEAELAEERTANAQLEERVKALKERQDTRLAKLEAEVGEQRQRLAAVDEEMQRLKQMNAELREVAGKLREAMSEEVAEPHLVNKAMLAELDALRAVRDAEAAEVAAAIGELKPLAQEET
ncbi:hypothetical protein OG2516_02973 [Oceanicola granulosus HTCC2516]|uniref:Uncharacterized protein n=1 Tax=Oceanicola granulosus (strain ATCC BAA-861 / DSM 15982 / KCTC 12143 / HTCC2516) TaxID=314256 RepID=Q2C9Q7_OCEGH|nr:hypothetical protein [Oceanicola granulosus]EAR49404.1 hypothetical protein OG2516_02973 [Oceanicola granulosus HTCC2516]